MDAYTQNISAADLKPTIVYKVTTIKSVFLGKFQGRNKNEQLHFFDTDTNRLVVLDPKIHIVSIQSEN
jgi:hypothetical protein